MNFEPGNVLEVNCVNYNNETITKVGVVVKSDVGEGLKDYLIYFGKSVNNEEFFEYHGWDDIEEFIYFEEYTITKKVDKVLNLNTKVLLQQYNEDLKKKTHSVIVNGKTVIVNDELFEQLQSCPIVEGV